MAETAIVFLTIFSLWLSPRIVGITGLSGQFAGVLNFYLAKAGSAIVFGILIVVFALQGGKISQVLRIPGFVFLGEISFALYLVHTIVLMWFREHFEQIFSPFPIFSTYILYWLGSIFAAYLLYVLIERKR